MDIREIYRLHQQYSHSPVTIDMGTAEDHAAAPALTYAAGGKRRWDQHKPALKVTAICCAFIVLATIAGLGAWGPVRQEGPGGFGGSGRARASHARSTDASAGRPCLGAGTCSRRKPSHAGSHRKLDALSAGCSICHGRAHCTGGSTTASRPFRSRGGAPRARSCAGEGRNSPGSARCSAYRAHRTRSSPCYAARAGTPTNRHGTARRYTTGTHHGSESSVRRREDVLRSKP